MIGVDPQVFVHVEGDDARPVDVLVGDQAGQKLVLAGRGGEDDVGTCQARAGASAIASATARAAARRPGPAISIDENLERIDRESSDCRELGGAHGRDSVARELIDCAPSANRKRARMPSADAGFPSRKLPGLRTECRLRACIAQCSFDRSSERGVLSA